MCVHTIRPAELGKGEIELWHQIQQTSPWFGNPFLSPEFSIAVGRFRPRTLRIGGYELEFFVQPGNEGFVEPYAELIGNALQFYEQKYGPAAFGRRLDVARHHADAVRVVAAEVGKHQVVCHLCGFGWFAACGSEDACDLGAEGSGGKRL